MPKIQDLSARSATAYEVATTLGKPDSYPQARMLYKACRDSEWGFIFLAGGPGGGIAGWDKLPEQCYALTFHFDQRDRVSHYELLDWPKKEEKFIVSEEITEGAVVNDNYFFH